MSDEITTGFGNDNSIDVIYDITGGRTVPDLINVNGINFNDPALYNAHFILLQNNEIEDEVFETKIDLDYEIDQGYLKTIQTGLAYSERTKSDRFSNNRARPGSTGNVCAFCGRRQVIPDGILSPFPFDDYLSQESGDFVREFAVLSDVDGYLSFLEAQSPGFSAISLDEGASPETTEEVLSAYVRADFEGEVSGVPWGGNIGLRLTDTQQTSVGSTVELLNVTLLDPLDPTSTGIISTVSEPFQGQASNDYTELLPSANIQFEPYDGMVVRGAVAKVITRPTLSSLALNQSFTGSNLDAFFSSGGNPLLEPFEAWQYDGALEFYRPNGDAFSVSIFYKDISTFVSEEVALIDESARFGIDGLIRSDTRQRNRDGGTIIGFELAALHNFDYLPEPFDGFGVQANYTFADSEDDNANVGLSDLVAAIAPASGLEGFAKHSYNLIAFYEKDKFSGRLAYNWRGDFLDQRVGLAEIAEQVESFGQLDASASYDVTDRISLVFEGINLTDENTLRFADDESRILLNAYTGQRFYVGARFKY